MVGFALTPLRGSALGLGGAETDAEAAGGAEAAAAPGAALSTGPATVTGAADAVGGAEGAVEVIVAGSVIPTADAAGAAPP